MNRIGRRIGSLCVIGLGSAICFAQAPGAQVYIPKCGGCHGVRGRVVSPVATSMGAKDAFDPSMLQLSPGQMFSSVKMGKGRMPRFGGRLSDDEIRQAVAYFRNLGRNPAPAAPQQAATLPENAVANQDAENMQPTAPAPAVLPEPVPAALHPAPAVPPPASQPPAASGHTSGETLTSRDVMQLTAAGLAERVILASIRQASATDFNLTPSGLIALRKAGVSNAVIEAMQERAASAPPSAAPVNSASVSPVAPVPARGTLTRQAAAELIVKGYGYPLSELVQINKSYLKRSWYAGNSSFPDVCVTVADHYQEGMFEAYAAQGLLTLGERTEQQGTCATLWETVTLTSEGRKFLMGETKGQYQLLNYLHTFEGVTGIQVLQEGSLAEAHYTIRDTGFTPFSTLHTPRIEEHSATFSLFDDGWRLNK